MTRKRVLTAMVAVMWLAAFAAQAQETTTGVCCNNGTPLIPADQQCVLLHRVGPGENLHILAAYYYGDARAWQRIYAFNKKTIGNPNKIKAGQILRIEVPPCWTPRFDLQEFLRLEEARSAIMARPAGERPREIRSRETVEAKVSVSVEDESGDTTVTATPPKRQAPGSGAPPSPVPPSPTPPGEGEEPGNIEIEE